MEPTEYPGAEYNADGTFRHAPFVPQRHAFNKRCAYCHNTYPCELRFYKLYTEFGMLSGFASGQGIEPQLVNALAREAGDLEVMRENMLPLDRLVTVGISYESCHFGGREHADKDREIRFVPTHPVLAKWTPDYKDARKRPEVVNAICRQCHHSGVGAPDNWPDGSAGVNSMEAIELDRGGCKRALKCTHCHNTHISGPDAGAPDRERHLAVCVDCHQNLQSQAAANAHSRHSSDLVSCLDCHMPRIVQGFSVSTRTHRIDSPTHPKILATGMPNAYIRLRFLQSVEKILGRRLGDHEYTLTGSPKQREKQIQRLLKQYLYTAVQKR